MTFVSGLLTTTVGILNISRLLSDPAVVQDAARWRAILSVGVFETTGNAVAGTAMGAAQVILWAIGTRYLARLHAPR